MISNVPPGKTWKAIHVSRRKVRCWAPKALVQVIDPQSSRTESRNGGKQGSKRISPIIAKAVAITLKKVTWRNNFISFDSKFSFRERFPIKKFIQIVHHRAIKVCSSVCSIIINFTDALSP